MTYLVNLALPAKAYEARVVGFGWVVAMEREESFTSLGHRVRVFVYVELT